MYPYVKANFQKAAAMPDPIEWMWRDALHKIVVPSASSSSAQPLDGSDGKRNVQRLVATLRLPDPMVDAPSGMCAQATPTGTCAAPSVPGTPCAPVTSNGLGHQRAVRIVVPMMCSCVASGINRSLTALLGELGSSPTRSVAIVAIDDAQHANESVSTCDALRVVNSMVGQDPRVLVVRASTPTAAKARGFAGCSGLGSSAIVATWGQLDAVVAGLAETDLIVPVMGGDWLAAGADEALAKVFDETMCLGAVSPSWTLWPSGALAIAQPQVPLTPAALSASFGTTPDVVSVAGWAVLSVRLSQCVRYAPCAHAPSFQLLQSRA